MIARMEGLASVYVDWSVSADTVREVIASLAVPEAVKEVVVDGGAATSAFDDYRVAVDLTGDFDRADGVSIARQYAAELRARLGVPAYCLSDLLVQKNLPG